ncbi:hypothetical protein tinsulaeT_23250 [Thalassotalea insulae]|uniref:Uncharacterized protein n=1 Tax=Thalassotalea insulae TaxID=2056778 RepID=A0ABQ6GWU5_9GAMM|nr:hypothetical protein [Thalassotalea insulae]GLX78985.1 hypothetical protein tinsulaeT_23250 [Thalassotalea insulae]
MKVIREIYGRSSYKFSTLFGIVGVVIGIFAFFFNYFMVPATLPGYSVLVAPAIFFLGFFTEELDFNTKMICYLSGQFFGYFTCAYLYHTVRFISKNSVDKI